MLLEKDPDLNKVYRSGFDIIEISPSVSRLLVKRMSRIEGSKGGVIDRFLELGPDLQYPLDHIVEIVRERCWRALRLFSKGSIIELRVWLGNAEHAANRNWQCDPYNQAALGFLISPPGERSLIQMSRVRFNIDDHAIVERSITSLPASSEKACIVLFNPSCITVEYRSLPSTNMDDTKLFLKGHFGELKHD